MSGRMLIGVVGAALIVVAALAVLTPTVVVDGGDASRVVIRTAHLVPGRLSRPNARPELPAAPRGRRLPDLRACLRSHGLGRPDQDAPRDLRKLRDALKVCHAPLSPPRS
jgi:hypothetical protein